MTANQASYERRLVALMFCTWGMLFLDRMSVLYIAPYIAPALHLAPAQIGQLAAITALTWAPSTLIFGIISDRIGRRRVLIPMIFGFSLMSILSGFAENFTQLMIARALLGVAEGPVWSVMNAIVERASRPQTRGRNIGIVVSAAALIGLAAAPVLSTQIAAQYGWQAACWVAGVPGIILGILVYLYVEEPRLSDDAGHADHAMRLSDLKLLVTNRNVLLCCLGASGFVCWLTLQSAFAPLYITNVMHRSGTEAGWLLGAAGAGSFVIGLFGPAQVRRFGMKKVVIFFASLSILLPLALLATPLYDTLWLLGLVLFCTHGGQAVVSTIMVMIPTASVPVRLAASAIGLCTMCGEWIGSVAAPVLAAGLIPSHGLAFPLEVAAAGMALVIVVALLIREPTPAMREG